MARVIAQIIVIGSQILGKAFIEAYKQAVANASRNSGAAVNNGGGGSSRVLDALTRKTGMTVDEACQILNVKKDIMNTDQITKSIMNITLHRSLASLDCYCSGNEKQKLETAKLTLPGTTKNNNCVVDIINGDINLNELKQ
nr:3083_t:CDS:2 [Entrophospora candida]